MMDERISEFEVGDILPLALTLGIAGIGIAYSLSVTSDVQDEIGTSGCLNTSYSYNSVTNACDVINGTTNNASHHPLSAAYNATESTIEGQKAFTDKFGLIATVLVAAILLGILYRYLMTKNG